MKSFQLWSKLYRTFFKVTKVGKMDLNVVLPMYRYVIEIDRKDGSTWDSSDLGLNGEIE